LPNNLVAFCVIISQSVYLSTTFIFELNHYFTEGVPWQSSEWWSFLHAKHATYFSVCFREFLCPSSGVFHCTHNNTYRFAVCTVKNSWWWTEELSETYRVSFQNKFEKLMRLVGFVIRNSSRCTATWTSKMQHTVEHSSSTVQGLLLHPLHCRGIVLLS